MPCQTDPNPSRLRKFGEVVLKAVPSVAAAAAAVIMLTLEWEREEDQTTRLTLQEIRTHKLRLNEIRNAHVCAAALLGIREQGGASALVFKSVEEPITCNSEWCVWYRRCIGETTDVVPDNSQIKITEDVAWAVALPVRMALESYESLAHLACTDTLNKKLVLDQFRTELHANSDILRYFSAVYSPSTNASIEQSPGMTAVIGALYPDEFNIWSKRWEHNCP